MENQPPAFSRTLDPETSREAAELVNTHAMDRLILGRLKHLKDDPHRGESSYEMVRSLNKERVSISPRIRPLAEANLIHDTGLRRRGIVWAYGPAPAGKEQPKRFNFRALRKKDMLALIEAAAKIRDYLEAKPQLTLEASVILNDHLNPALAAVGRPSKREADNGSH
jgi:hypothetical protein